MSEINGKYLQLRDFKDDPFTDLLKKTNVYLMNGDTIHIGIVNKPDNLVGEKFTIVLRGQVWFSGLRGVQL